MDSFISIMSLSPDVGLNGHHHFYQKKIHKQKREALFLASLLFPSGERGIRTPGTSQYVGFQDRCNRPLCHLSNSTPSGVRTLDPLIKSQMLYQLSY